MALLSKRSMDLFRILLKFKFQVKIVVSILEWVIYLKVNHQVNVTFFCKSWRINRAK